MIPKLEKLENECKRIIVGATARCSTILLNNEIGWPGLDQRRHCQIHELAPTCLTYIIRKITNSVNGNLLRRNNNIKVPVARSEKNYSKNRFFRVVSNSGMI